LTSIEKIVARASKATGRNEFTCDTVLCGLRHAGNPNRSTQTGSGTKQRLTRSADNSAPIRFPNCALICLGSRVSLGLPLAQMNSGGKPALLLKFLGRYTDARAPRSAGPNYTGAVRALLQS